MNLAELRSRLTIALIGRLGVYTLANGSTTPAISARPEGMPMAPGTTVRGIEAVILAEPALTPVVQYGDQQTFPVWTVFLVDWGDGAHMDSAVRSVIAAFPGSEAVPLAVPQGVGPQHQIRLTIRGLSTVRPYVYDLEADSGSYALTGQDVTLGT